MRRFYVEHGRQVALAKLRVGYEVAGLRRCRRACGEEVVSAAGDALRTCSQIVGGEVAVAYGGALRRLDVAEGDGVVHGALHALLRYGAEVRDANLAPVDGVVASSHVVLEARDVDAVDTVCGVFQTLSKIAVSPPFAHSEALVSCQRKTEARALTVHPVAEIYAVLRTREQAVTVSNGVAVHRARVSARRVGARATYQRVRPPCSDDAVA